MKRFHANVWVAKFSGGELSCELSARATDSCCV